MIEIHELSEVASVFNGKTPSKIDQRDRGFPVLKIRDVTENGQFVGAFQSFVEAQFAASFPTKIIREGDTLILNAAHNADYVASKVYRAESRVAGSLATGEWLIIRSDTKRLDARYLNYWIQTSQTKRNLKELVKGIHLYPKDVEHLAIPTPLLDQQRCIAALLDKADRLRRTRRYARQLSDTFLQSVFLEMFGDPVTNPMGWDVAELGSHLSNIDSGWSPVCNETRTTSNEWAVLRLSAITSGLYLPDENKQLPVGLGPRHELEVKNGDILFGRKNTYDLVGATVLVHRTPPRLMLPDTIFRFRIAADSTLQPEYLFGLLNNQGFKKKVQSLASGTSGSMPNISKEKLMELSISLPDPFVQSRFCVAVRRFERLRLQQAEAERQAEHLFQTLLHRAFRGELSGEETIPEVEASVSVGPVQPSLGL